MSVTFTKLVSSLPESSVWCEPYPTRIVWVTMLAKADQNGFVRASVPGLARVAGVTLAECTAALQTFLSPDKYSSTKEHEGRRVEAIDGGWRLLNYLKYREQRDDIKRRESQTIRQQERRNGDLQNSGRTQGYIYYAQNGELIKIGFSVNPWSRIHELKCSCPQMQLVALERGTIQDEHARHAQFTAIRVEREWFRLTPELTEHITSLPDIEKIKHGRYHYSNPSPVVKTVVDSSNYDELRSTTKPQAEAEAEADKEREIARPSNSDELIHEIGYTYPANSHLLGRELPCNQLSAIMDAIQRDGFELVLAGTRNYRDAVLQWPPGEKRFVVNPVKFYGESFYLKDPEEWRRDGRSTSKSPAQQRAERILDTSRKVGEVIRQRIEEVAASDPARIDRGGAVDLGGGAFLLPDRGGSGRA